MVNNTKVIPARLIGKRGEATISITLHQQVSDAEWLVFAKPAKKLRLGDAVGLGGDFSAEVAELGADGIRKLRFNREGVALMEALHKHGTMPPAALYRPPQWCRIYRCARLPKHVRPPRRCSRRPHREPTF